MLDVLVVGGGYVGLSAAVAIKQAAPHLAVEVVEAAPEDAWKKDLRASAIIAAATKMLDVFGLWDRIEPDAQPITRMIVTDSKTSDPVRPVFLTFDGAVEDVGPDRLHLRAWPQRRGAAAETAQPVEPFDLGPLQPAGRGDADPPGGGAGGRRTHRAGGDGKRA